jgi:hypothetical protein
MMKNIGTQEAKKTDPSIGLFPWWLSLIRHVLSCHALSSGGANWEFHELIARQSKKIRGRFTLPGRMFIQLPVTSQT